MSLRVIGDVHAQIDFTLSREANSYLDIVSDCEFSVQIGDMGDAKTYGELIAHVDSNSHRFFGGNHDHYPYLPPHALGDYGMKSLGGVDFFFVRGARSNDKKRLLETGEKLGKTLWYEEEELSCESHDSVVESYQTVKPDIVLSHTCPASIVDLIRGFAASESRFASASNAGNSDTELLLQRMLECHQPKLWCFGHYHHNWRYLEANTEFRCIGELSYFDI